MGKAGRKDKLGFAQLALVDWLLEAPTTRFVLGNVNLYSSLYVSKALTLCEVIDGDTVTLASPATTTTNVELEDRLGGSFEIDIRLLVEEKVLHSNRSTAESANGDQKNGFVQFMESIGCTEFNSPHGHRLLRAVSKTAEWWGSVGKAQFDELKDKRDAVRREAARTIVIGARMVVEPRIDPPKAKTFPEGFRHPIPNLVLTRPTYTATVVKETKSRLYVQNVVRIRPEPRYREGSENHPIQGRAPNQYVERSHVMADGISALSPARMLEVDAERVDSYHESCDKALTAVLEPLLSLHNRLFQAKAMHDDLMKDAVDADTKG